LTLSSGSFSDVYRFFANRNAFVARLPHRHSERMVNLPPGVLLRPSECPYERMFASMLALKALGFSRLQEVLAIPESFKKPQKPCSRPRAVFLGSRQKAALFRHRRQIPRQSVVASAQIRLKTASPLADSPSSATTRNRGRRRDHPTNLPSTPPPPPPPPPTPPLPPHPPPTPPTPPPPPPPPVSLGTRPGLQFLYRRFAPDVTK